MFFVFSIFFCFGVFFTVNWAMIIIMLFILVCFMSDHKVQVIFSFKIWESVGLSHNIEGYDRNHWS